MNPGNGVVYTESIVHSPPEQFVNEAPYQLLIVALDAGGKLTGRVDGDRVAIGDRVAFVDDRGGIPFFRKS